jgi:hypothetical protein
MMLVNVIVRLSLSSCEGRASEQSLNEMYVNRDSVSCNCRRRSGPDQWQWQEQLPVTERQCARRGEVNLIARNRFRGTRFNTTQRRRPRPEWHTIQSLTHPPTHPLNQLDRSTHKCASVVPMQCNALRVRCAALIRFAAVLSLLSLCCCRCSGPRLAAGIAGSYLRISTLSPLWCTYLLCACVLGVCWCCL